MGQLGTSSLIENPAGGEADEFIVGCFAFELACRRMFR